MVTCAATSGHCCWVAGVVCPFLRHDGPVAVRRWVCTLREELGSWDAVHADARYRRLVRAPMAGVVTADCGDWPPPGETCAECGVVGAD